MLTAMTVAYRRTTPLPASPPLTEPAAHAATQPLRGVAGLLFVVPMFVLLTFGAGGADQTLRVLGPVCTYALPVLAVIAFWWEDWPGSALRAGWSGLTDTLIILVAGVLLTMLGQVVIGDVDLPGIFDGEAFPHTMPLAGAVFVATLQLTLVNEGWPLRSLPRIPAGTAALVVGWVIGLAIYRSVDGTLLVTIGAAQVLFFVTLRGWPFSGITNRGIRLPVSNISVIAVGWVSYVVMDALGWSPMAVSGCVIGAGLLTAMLFENWPWTKLSPRLGAVTAHLVLSGLLYWAISSLRPDLTHMPLDMWVAITAMNGIGIAVILHVAIWRRWPITKGES
jgi:hypothetical protein